MPATTAALLQSLIDGPLLVGDLPEARRFPHHRLALPATVAPLDLQQKLGHLCEDALAVLLESSADYDLLARGHQVQAGAHATLGELDFLVRDRGSGQLVHLELAAKFYLAVWSDDGLALPGPDARDNYFRKLRRLRTHQLVLGETYRAHLPAAFRDGSFVSQQLVYGCLFDPIGAPESASAEFISPHCRRGRWFHADTWFHHFAPDTRFHIIPKPLWLVPPDALGGFALEPWDPRTPADRCLMLRVGGDSLPYFVAPPGYPHHVASVRE